MVQYDTPINANDDSFEQVVLQSPLPVAVVFWAKGKVPRQKLNDVLDQAASEYAGEALVVKLDTADVPQARALYQVSQLPQFLFFRQGKLVARARGLPTAEMLRPWMEYLLERGPKPAAKKKKQEEKEEQQPQSEPPRNDIPRIVTDADFERVVLGASLPVLVDFWAAWCGPCRMVAPTVEQLAKEFAGKALVAKLDVDANPATAQRYGVQSIPTLIYFRGGQEVDRVLGAQPAHVLKQRLEVLL